MGHIILGTKNNFSSSWKFPYSQLVHLSNYAWSSLRLIEQLFQAAERGSLADEWETRKPSVALHHLLWRIHVGNWDLVVYLH